MKPHLLRNRVFRTIARWIGVAGLFILGWELAGPAPKEKKYVMIGAPHTSNWDFVFFLLVIFAMELPFKWKAKDSLFSPPFRNLLIRLGGIPVDRSRRNNVVANTAKAFRNSDEMMLAIAPSGTRSKVKKWKSGFYHMAVQGEVPVVCGFLDYRRKVGGLGPVFYPTGNIEHDMAEIQSFYRDIAGKNPI